MVARAAAGGELLRLLSAHPDLDVTTVTAFQSAGHPPVSLRPHLRSLAHLELQPTDAATLAGHDVVFLALPHGKAANNAAGVLAGAKFGAVLRALESENRCGSVCLASVLAWCPTHR